MPASGKIIHGEKFRGHTSLEYKTWLGMKSRCYRPTNKDYPKWGGRGIEVCDRWKTSFTNFLEDMGRRPTPKHTIDRIDSSLNYSKENCRWATQSEQGSEHRKNLVPIEIDGLHFSSTSAACRYFGVGLTTYLKRINDGRTVEEALKRAAYSFKPRRTIESYKHIKNR